MQLFLKLFAPHLPWFYHCFDRIVIHGYLSYSTREINVAWFFRQVCHKPKVTKEVLTERTRVYQAWWRLTPAITTGPWSGPGKACVRRIWRARASNA